MPHGLLDSDDFLDQQSCIESFHTNMTTDTLEKITGLQELDWWHLVEKDPVAYNYRTRTHLTNTPVETLLDGGAGVSSAPEELIVAAYNLAIANG